MKNSKWIAGLGLISLLILSCKTTLNIEPESTIKMETIDSTYWVGTEQNGILLVSKNGYFGLADKNKTLITAVKYDRIFPFHEGMAIICKDHMYGVLDARGKEIVAPTYQFLADYKNGLSYGRTPGSEDAILNKQGQNIVPGKNVRISAINGRYIQMDGEGYFHVFNQEGNKIYSVNMWAFGEKGEKLWRGNNVWWFTGGNPDSDYREAQGVFQRKPKIPAYLPFYFNEGLALVPQLVDDQLKFGFIDEQGKVVIPIEFDNAHYFVNGYACVKRNEKWGVIDKQGKWVIQPVYENLENANGNYFMFTEKTLQGVIDLTGNVKITPRFLKVDYLFDDLFAVLEDNEITRRNAIEYKNGFDPTPGIAFWGCISAQTGDVILPFTFNEIIGIDEHIGAGVNYEFAEHATEESVRATQLSLNQAAPMNYSGKASETIFTASGKKGTYLVSEIWIYHSSFSPDFQHIKQFELRRKVDDHLYIGGVFLDDNANELTDQNRINDLQSKLSAGKPIIDQNSKNQLFGAAMPNGKQVLPTDFEQLKITPTGIIAKKNSKYGYYDFNGTLLIPHLYFNMSEFSTGIIEAFTEENNSGGVLLNKAGKELKTD